MPSSYSTNLKIELQATGENSGTWGTITNTNLGTALEQAIIGYGNPNYLSDANLTLTYTDTNSAQTARALVLNVTSALSLTGTRELVVPTIQKQYIVQNNTTGGQSITVKTSAGTGITVPNGRKAHLYVNGTDVIFMDDFVDINGGTVDNTVIGGATAAAGTFTTLGATTGNITTVNATTVDTTNVEVTNIKAKDGTAAGSIADSTGVVTLASSVLTTTDINGGTIDGTTIGGSSAAAGTFTTLTTSSTVTLNGGTANGVLFLNGSKVATSGSALTFDGTTLATTGKFGITGSGAVPTASALQIGTNAAGSRWLYNVPTGGEHNFTENGTVLSWQNISSLGWLIGGSEQMRLTSTGLGIGTSSPAVKLEVAGGTNTEVRIVSSGSLASTASAICRFGGSNNATSGYVGYPGVANDYYIWNALSGNIVLGTANGVKATLDSSGNLGLGETPRAWSAQWKTLQIGQGHTALVGRSDAIATYYGSNWLYDGADKYIANGFASIYSQQSGQHSWFTAPSGTAGNAISFTQAMTLENGGQLLVGTTTKGAGNNNNTFFTVAGGATVYTSLIASGGQELNLIAQSGLLGVYARSNDPLLFGTNNTERARITSDGFLLVGTTNTSDTAGNGVKIQPNTGGVGAGKIVCVGNTTSTSLYPLMVYSTSVSNFRFYVDYDGSVYARNTSIISLSDARLKENIRDLDVGLDAVLALKPRKFDWKEGKGQDKKDVRGFIAQEIEEVFPDLVSNWADPAPEGEEPYKSVRQDLIPVLVKAIQELKAELDATKAKVAALESK